MQDKVFDLVENMTGRRDLPTGKTFGQVIADTQQTINEYVKEVEPAFRNVYVPLINELVEQAKANGNKIKSDDADAKEEKVSGDVNPSDTSNEEPVELDSHTGMPKA